MGTLFAHECAAARNHQWIRCALSLGSMTANKNFENKRKITEGVLIAVTAQIYGHQI